MGVDIHALNFLNFSKMKKNNFGKVLTIGKQRYFVEKNDYKFVVPNNFRCKKHEYLDGILFENFNAKKVVSLDNSKFENAEIIHDLNNEVSNDIEKFDTIIDCGSLEHIYNIKQAFKNLSLLANNNAQIIHILPSNNFSGHGFWQFSPELFFSLYSEKNGYKNTEIFLADTSKKDIWWQAIKPKPGIRVEFQSLNRVHILVRTEIGATFSHEHIQQSDYVEQWDKNSVNTDTIKNKNFFSRIIRNFKLMIKNLFKNKTITFHKNNKYLIKKKIKEVIY